MGQTHFDKHPPISDPFRDKHYEAGGWDGNGEKKTAASERNKKKEGGQVPTEHNPSPWNI